MSRSLRARGLKSNPLGNVRTRSAMSRSLRARGLKLKMRLKFLNERWSRSLRARGLKC